MGICSKRRANSGAKGRRTPEQKIALAKRIGVQAKISFALKQADKLESEMIELNRRIAHTKEGSTARKDLVNLILDKNSKRAAWAINAQKLHETIKK